MLVVTLELFKTEELSITGLSSTAVPTSSVTGDEHPSEGEFLMQIVCFVGHYDLNFWFVLFACIFCFM